MSIDPLDHLCSTRTSIDMEGELSDLKEKNTALVKKVQHWKMLAAQRENEKLDLMKEINDLRLKLGRLRSEGAETARVLDISLQSAIEEALSHLVQSSSAMARTLEIAKTYMRKRQESEEKSPRWSNLSTPNRMSEKVNKVRPMLVGGRSIQPVVLLSHPPDLQAGSRNTVQNRNAPERVLPVHMLQDLYIPLQRINSADYNRSVQGNENSEDEALESTDTHDAGLINENGEHARETSDIVEDDFENSRRLTAVDEELETDEGSGRVNRSRSDNPLEGPSWLLDAVSQPTDKRNAPINEPDSTTEPDEALTACTAASPACASDDANVPKVDVQEGTKTVGREAFTPTVRRRKRPASPAPASSSARSPALSLSPSLSTAASPAATRPTRPSEECRNNGRVLKVMISKIRLEGAERLRVQSGAAADGTPPKRLAACFDAPSPNGATDNAVIVMEERYNASVQSQNSSRGSTSSGSERDVSAGGASGGEGRTRRPRKQVTYKEKPLNMKLRR